MFKIGEYIFHSTRHLPYAQLPTSVDYSVYWHISTGHSTNWL